MTRRSLMAVLGAPLFCNGQMATRGVQATVRGKSSGLPFNSSLVDVASEAGLNRPVIYGGIDSNAYIVEAIGCGAAFLDYDDDGWLDIFLLSGLRWEGVPQGATNRLYKNNRDGTFTDVTAKAGLTHSGWMSGVTVADFNNDGFEDIFVTGWGQNILYRNNGDGTFTDVTKQAGLDCEGQRWSTGCAFFDFDRDGHLDLFLSHYLKFDPKKIPATGMSAGCNFRGVPVNCGPRDLPAETCSLYRNNGDGTFTDITAKSGVGRVTGSYGLTVAAADFDGDGWPEVYVACDSTPSLLFKRQEDGTFAEKGLELGVALNEDGQEQAGMGLAVGDYNLDGRLDILKTHFTGDTSALYRNIGQSAFEDCTIRSGLGVETRYVSWGAAIVDLDNNGHPDLFWVTGSVYPEVEKRLPQYPNKTPRVVFRNLGNGRFEELLSGAGPGVPAPHSSRGCAIGDFDNDGDMDILVVNLNEPPSLLRNDVKGDHRWIKTKLVGVKSNRSAVGAQVIARYGGKVQIQEVLSQSGFLSTSDKRLHFGLGQVESVDLEVRWPSGIRQEFKGVRPNRLVTIDEVKGITNVERFNGR